MKEKATERREESSYDDDLPILTETRTLSQAGRVVALHIPADIVKRFRASAQTKVEVRVVERRGRPILEIPLPSGVSRDDVVRMARERKWRVEESTQEADGEWSVEVVHGRATMRLDSRTRAGTHLLNNLFVEGAPFLVKRTAEYELLHDLAVKHGLSLLINDAEGLWTRLTASQLVDISDSPDPELVAKFLNTVPELFIRFGRHLRSLEVTVEDLESLVDSVNLASTAARKHVRFARPTSPQGILRAS